MVDMTNDVIRLEKLFADRFTEKDNEFMDLKSKSLPNPVVIHPWKILRRQWTKRWDYSSRRNQDDRGQRGGYRNDDRHRQNSYDKHRDRSRDGENSRERYRDRSEDSRQYRDRSEGGRQDRNRSEGGRQDRNRSEDGRQDRNRDSQDVRHREKKYDFHSNLKPYQDR